MAQTGNVDVISGDWLSEINIAWNAIIKRENPKIVREVGFWSSYPRALTQLPIRRPKL
jgi:hypothetical protein